MTVTRFLLLTAGGIVLPGSQAVTVSKEESSKGESSKEESIMATKKKSSKNKAPSKKSRRALIDSIMSMPSMHGRVSMPSACHGRVSVTSRRSSVSRSSRKSFDPARKSESSPHEKSDSSLHEKSRAIILPFLRKFASRSNSHPISSTIQKYDSTPTTFQDIFQLVLDSHLARNGFPKLGAELKAILQPLCTGLCKETNPRSLSQETNPSSSYTRCNTGSRRNVTVPKDDTLLKSKDDTLKIKDLEKLSKKVEKLETQLKNNIGCAYIAGVCQTLTTRGVTFVLRDLAAQPRSNWHHGFCSPREMRVKIESISLFLKLRQMAKGQQKIANKMKKKLGRSCLTSQSNTGSQRNSTGSESNAGSALQSSLTSHGDSQNSPSPRNTSQWSYSGKWKHGTSRSTPGNQTRQSNGKDKDKDATISHIWIKCPRTGKYVKTNTGRNQEWLLIGINIAKKIETLAWESELAWENETLCPETQRIQQNLQPETRRKLFERKCDLRSMQKSLLPTQYPEYYPVSLPALLQLVNFADFETWEELFDDAVVSPICKEFLCPLMGVSKGLSGKSASNLGGNQNWSDILQAMRKFRTLLKVARQMRQFGY